MLIGEVVKYTDGSNFNIGKSLNKVIEDWSLVFLFLPVLVDKGALLAAVLGSVDLEVIEVLINPDSELFGAFLESLHSSR